MYAKTLTYIGPHDRVIVDRPDGTRAFVDQGGDVVTTADHAAALLQQPSNWRAVAKTKAKEEQAT